jgi:hypothetical protein
MKIKIIMAIVTALCMMTTCNPPHSKKPGRKMLIPEDKLVEILTDTYLTSGMLERPALKQTWGQRDSILNYIDVIKSHGYTYQQFDATLKYYFTGRQKKLNRIYDRVTGNLLEMEVMITTSKSSADTIPDDNLWPGKASYGLPEDFPRDPIWFDIPVSLPGQYVLKADIQVFKDDKSLDPRVTVFFSTVDSAGIERRDYWDEVRLTKNGQFQNIEISNNLDTADGVHIRGWLLNHTNQPGSWEKHARIRNISLRLLKEVITQK